MTDHRGTTTYKYQGGSGFLTEIQYPDGVQLINNYDLNKKTGYELRSPQANVKVNAAFNNMNRQETLGIVSGNSVVNIQYGYSKSGLVTSQKYGEMFTAYRIYTDTRLVSLRYVTKSGLMNLFQYTYDNNQNIIFRDENSQFTNFTYTSLNQVKTSSEFEETYSYDARYNRLTLESNRELPIKQTQYEYDSLNRLTKVIGDHNPVTYAYTGEGLLYERTESNTKNRYYYDENELLLAEAVVVNGQAQVRYVYVHDLTGKLIGRQDVTSGKMQYYQLNGHGDVVALVDEQGKKLNEYRYDIWGQTLEEKESVQNILKYSGEYWDKTTGLQYLRARWYDPGMGRFINEDTYEGTLNDPLSQNLYTYVLNNPLIYTDPSGHYCVSNDGNWAHGGKCSSSSSTYLGDDENLTGVPIIENGYRVGFLNVGKTDRVADNYYNSSNAFYYLSLVDRGVYEDEQTWFVIEMLSGGASLLKSLVKKGATTAAKKSGTVWDSIKATQEVYSGTKIPKSFELKAGKNKFWVHANATEHMEEYVTRNISLGRDINTQGLLTSFQSAVQYATRKGITYDQIINVGGWELKFSKPRADGQLPAIIHALFK